MGKNKWLWIAPCAAVAALLATPRVARAFKQWEQAKRQAIMQEARAAVAAGADGLPDLTALLGPDEGPADPDSRDNAEIRSLAMAAEIGPRTPETQQMLLQIAAQESLRWADPFAVPAGVSSPGTRTWRNIGPQAARTEFNGTFYKAMDSGRPTALAVHPTDTHTVFLATSGGGLWSARDFNSNAPTWTPLTETLGSLAVGAFAVGPSATPGGPVTIWLGLGDAFDQQSGVVVKGTWSPDPAVSGSPPTGSAVWQTPIVLSTAAHPADFQPSAALNVRDIKIDPLDANHILVATNDGLYQSIDGTTFSLVDLPNSIGLTRESTWQIVYLGSAAGQSQWLVSGVYACPQITGMTLAPSPPAAGAGTFSCPGDASHYNAGDIWKSVNSGVTWTSARATGALPATVTSSPRIDMGRIALGAGSTTDPTTTVVYAQSATAQESSLPVGCFPAPPVPTGGTLCTLVTQTAWYLKSTDGGTTWTTIANGLNVTSPPNPSTMTPTPLANPTTLTGDPTTNNQNVGCTGMNLGHVQSWYNLSVAVDPANPNRAIFGGDLCSAITKDGGATYWASSHWLPQNGSGFTANGFLPYVHADWHTSLAYQDAGVTVLLAGTDGGLFVTRNIWDVTSPELGQWQQPDVGLTTHLFYGIGSGDPTLGNPNVVFGGLQDNGTRWRLVDDSSFIFDFNAGNWDQIVGGDGFGAAVTSDTAGQNPVYWISVNGARRFCRPRSHDCSRATRIENGVESANWVSPGTVSGGDPFLIRYTPAGDDTSGVLSATNNFALIWFVNQFDQASIRTLANTSSVNIDGIAGGRQTRGMGFRASPYRYTLDGLPNTRIYGGVLTSGTTGMGAYVTIDHGPPPAIAPVTLVGINSVHFAPGAVLAPGTTFAGTGAGTGTIWIGNGSDIAFPQSPASLGGTDSKQTWLVASNAVLSNAVNCGNPTALNCDPAIVIPPQVGHLFKTTDRGATWMPFHGDGSGFDLPNVPIYVVKYDPTDTTDQTIWVGTELGLYRTTDGGTTWGRYGLGLPMVRVTDIQISNNGSLVRVSTYGRGVWEIYPNSEPAVANGSGDFDRTKVIDFFNLASLAARMGADPDTATNLVYDSSLDLNTAIPAGKTKTTIDESDLTLLLSSFGSNLP